MKDSEGERESGSEKRCVSLGVGAAVEEQVPQEAHDGPPSHAAGALTLTAYATWLTVLQLTAQASMLSQLKQTLVVVVVPRHLSREAHFPARLHNRCSR